MADKHKDFFKVAVFERQQHQATLKLVAEYVERTRQRGANGMWADRFCMLCQRLSPQRQTECTHVTARARVQAELARLAQPLRLHEPIPESYADKTGTE